MESLLHGKLSHRAFSLLITRDDPYVLVGDTIHAYTEAEYYAINSVPDSVELTEEAFSHVLGMDCSFMSDTDAAAVKYIRGELPNCNSCRYKKFKDAVYKLIKRYGISLPSGLAAEMKREVKPYPEVSEPVVSTLGKGFDRLLQPTYMARKACLDCVEKHLSQAFVLAGEVSNGYPEHMSLLYAHLKEALDESPEEAVRLRETLKFCMAKSALTGEPLVPLASLSKLMLELRLADKGVDGNGHEVKDNPMLRLDVDVLVAAERSLYRDNELFRSRLEAADRFMEKYRESGSEEDRIGWEGNMAAAAECIAQVAPETAALLRSRRLMFVASPDLAEASGYGNADLLQLISL